MQSSQNTIDALQLAAKWLADCVSSHSSCNAATPTQTPTRVVHVGATINEVRVCYAANIPKLRYATLSHCWGAIKFEVLQTGNLEQFKLSIPPAALSQTFKDAIHIARELGIAYIWIDSLCIVQDDPDDWRRESKMMGGIYGGSVINSKWQNEYTPLTISPIRTRLGLTLVGSVHIIIC